MRLRDRTWVENLLIGIAGFITIVWAIFIVYAIVVDIRDNPDNNAPWLKEMRGIQQDERNDNADIS